VWTRCTWLRIRKSGGGGALTKTVMNLGVPENVGNFLSSRVTIGFLMTQHQGITQLLPEGMKFLYSNTAVSFRDTLLVHKALRSTTIYVAALITDFSTI
jgi:ABC-type Co2+ transport system permease subunit